MGKNKNYNVHYEILIKNNGNQKIIFFFNNFIINFWSDTKIFKVVCFKVVCFKITFTSFP